jgi:hypothetical protein
MATMAGVMPPSSPVSGPWPASSRNRATARSRCHAAVWMAEAPSVRRWKLLQLQNLGETSDVAGPTGCTNAQSNAC